MLNKVFCGSIQPARPLPITQPDQPTRLTILDFVYIKHKHVWPKSQLSLQAIDRGENLTNLNDKAENLRDSVCPYLIPVFHYQAIDLVCQEYVVLRFFYFFQAQQFKKAGTKIRRKMWYQNMKIKLVVLGILLLLVLVIWLSICHGFDCTNWE